MANKNNIFAGAGLERSVHRRPDDDWLERALHSAETRFVAMWRGKHLVRPIATPTALSWLRGEQLGAAAASLEPVFLGVFRDRPCFALELPDSEKPPVPADMDAAFHGLRGVATLVEEQEAALLAYAQGMLLWHARHRYCPACGAPTASASAGHLRICTAAGCGTHQFPRTDPAIIVLVSDGERCLLGRQPNWPEGLYSTIAGFVEPGESLEDAVVREVAEETNIQVGDVHYHSSQPWPFPASIMLGFMARGISADIRLNDGELIDARWFTRAQISTMLRAGTGGLPARLSIAFRLLSDWFDGQEEGTLARLLAETES